jgi:hypothetical protein
MDAADIFGIAVAVLIGLGTLAVEAWSKTWWAGIAISGTIATVIGVHILWKSLPVSAKTRLTPIVWSSGGKIRGWIAIACFGVVLGGYWSLLKPKNHSGTIVAMPLPEPRPPEAPKPPAVAATRSFVSMSAIDIMVLYKQSKTPDDFKIYWGTWIKMSALITRCCGINGEDSMTAYVGYPQDSRFMTMQFNRKKWESLLSSLRIGYSITAICQIKLIGLDFIDLEHCELTI